MLTCPLPVEGNGWEITQPGAQIQVGTSTISETGQINSRIFRRMGTKHRHIGASHRHKPAKYLLFGYQGCIFTIETNPKTPER